MLTCPKCGHNHVAGPRYKKGLFGNEYLEYMCLRCGYIETEKTQDTIVDERIKAYRKKMGEI